MELRQLKTFQIVAGTASFTQAAVVLNYAQSSVTAQIQSLEKELGVPLFDRIGRATRLTESGRQLLDYATRMLDLAEEAQTAVAGPGKVEGALSIGAPETVCTYRLPAVLRHFRSSYPAVQLSFRPMLDVDLFASVKKGALDAGFLLQEPLKSNSIEVENLIEEPLLVISAADHPLARLSLVTAGDLEGETLLLTEAGCGYRQLFEHEFTRAGVYSLVKLEFNSIEAIKQCVMAGLGIGFLPQVAVAKELESEKLCALRWERPFRVNTQMIYNREKWHSPVLQAFLQTCREMLDK
jgi:DNA-binding transcriptional LysR family regulator